MKKVLQFSILFLTCSLRYALELGARNNDMECNKSVVFPFQGNVAESVVSYELGESRGLTDVTMKKKITQIIAKIATSDPIKHNKLNYDTALISLMLNNLLVKDFSKIHIRKFETSLSNGTLAVDLAIPTITGSISKWKLTGNVLFGDGHVWFDLRDITISMKADINIISGRISNLRIKPSIKSAKVSITGAQKDKRVSQIYGRLLTKFLMEEVNNNHDLHTVISIIAEQYIKRSTR